MLFHGRGADEYDLFPLLDALDPERRLVGLAPRGPLSLPPGGAHWYERSTFVIDADGNVVKELRRVDPSTHADAVLEALPG